VIILLPRTKKDPPTLDKTSKTNILMYEGLMMKVYKTLTTIVVIIAVFLIVIGGIYLIINYKYDQIEKLINEAELRKTDETHEKEKLEYEAEERKKLEYSDEEKKRLQKEDFQNQELQYQLILQTVKENSDYYADFSKRFLIEFEKYGHDEWYDKSGVFDLYKVRDKLENEYNSDLLGNIDNVRIRNIEGVIFVRFKYPNAIIGIDYYAPDPYQQYSYDCSIIYIPDEYMNEESIAILYRFLDGFTDENLGNNLFVAKQSIMGYNYVYEVNDPV
jgi:uncharacterized protein YxeA